MKPFALLFTGMSGSGKSSVGYMMKRRFRDELGIEIEHIVFDTLRKQILKQQPYIDPYSPDPAIKKTIYERCGDAIAKVLEEGTPVIIDTGAGEESNRTLLLKKLENYPCVLVYFSAGRLLQIYRETRRSILNRQINRGKFLYLRAYCSFLNPFQKKKFPMTGVTKAYQVPQNADIVLNTAKISLNESCTIIINFLRERHYI